MRWKRKDTDEERERESIKKKVKVSRIDFLYFQKMKMEIFCKKEDFPVWYIQKS